MAQIVTDLLHGFARDGYTHAILISGHYPNRSQYLDTVWRPISKRVALYAYWHWLKIRYRGCGDHAAKYETSSMLYLEPSLVDLEPLRGQPDNDMVAPNNESTGWVRNIKAIHAMAWWG